MKNIMGKSKRKSKQLLKTIKVGDKKKLLKDNSRKF